MIQTATGFSSKAVQIAVIAVLSAANQQQSVQFLP